MVALFKKGKEGNLKISDIYKPLPGDECRNLSDRFEEFWEQETSRARRKNCNPNLLRAICKMFAARYMFLGFLVFIQYVIIR